MEWSITNRRNLEPRKLVRVRLNVPDTLLSSAAKAALRGAGTTPDVTVCAVHRTGASRFDKIEREIVRCLNSRMTRHSVVR